MTQRRELTPKIECAFTKASYDSQEPRSEPFAHSIDVSKQTDCGENLFIDKSVFVRIAWRREHPEDAQRLSECVCILKC